MLGLLTWVVVIAVLGVAIHNYGWPWQWWDKGVEKIQQVQSGKPRPGTPLADLSPRVRRLIRQPGFQHRFVQILFSEGDSRGRVTRWEVGTVKVGMGKDPDGRMKAYLLRLLRTLNRLQTATRFVFTDSWWVQIRIDFVSRMRFKIETLGEGDILGVCKWQEAGVPLGKKRMARADIFIDRDRSAQYPDGLAVVLVHELDHALGFGGHLHNIEDRRRSVLYYGSSVPDLTAFDRAAIRVLYSRDLKTGMSSDEVTRVLSAGRERSQTGVASYPWVTWTGPAVSGSPMDRESSLPSVESLAS